MRLKKWTIITAFVVFFISAGNSCIANAAALSSVNLTAAPEIKMKQNYNVNPVESAARTATYTYVNPMYQESEQPSFIAGIFNNAPVFNGSGIKEFATVADAGSYMRKELVKRTSIISVTVDKPYYNNMHKDIFNQAIADSAGGSSSEGDYLYAHFYGYLCNISYTSSYSTITYSMSYLSTYNEEQQVNTKVKNILNMLNVYNCDEYTKIKAVHDYEVKNIKYDYTFIKHSAYNAIVENKVVCQGFASLTYKMLKELGIKVRYITGTGNGGGHAWNIACINGKWYNLDNTWDQNLSILPDITYEYFLKNNADFNDHVRNLEYNNVIFNKSYPMDNISYVYNPIKVKSITLNKTSLSIVKGNTATLKAVISPGNASNKDVSWKSSNEKVVKVDANGKVTSVGAGSAIITCCAKDGSGKSAACKVTVTNPVKVTSIALNKKSLSVKKGKTAVLAVTILPGNAANRGVTWNSSNTSVVKVDAGGKLTGVGTGMATITCRTTDGSNKVVKCTVIVTK